MTTKIDFGIPLNVQCEDFKHTILRFITSVD